MRRKRFSLSSSRRPKTPGGDLRSTNGPPACSLVPDGATPGSVIFDAAAWKPADVILFAELEKNIGSGLIALAQRKQYPRHAEWTHAAVYVGRGKIVEALLGDYRQVVERSIAEYAPSRGIRVLRHPGLTDAQRESVAKAAIAIRDLPYSRKRALALAAELWGSGEGTGAAAKELQGAKFAGVCSDVVYSAYVAGADEYTITEQGTPCPAALAASDVFVPIDHSTCQVPMPS